MISYPKIRRFNRSKQYGYSSRAAQTSDIGSSFFDDIKSLCLSGQQPDSLPNLSAAMLCSIACAFHGREDISTEYLERGFDMGVRMGLFGVKHDPDAYETISRMPPNVLKATSQTAWGAYCYLA